MMKWAPFYTRKNCGRISSKKSDIKNKPLRVAISARAKRRKEFIQLNDKVQLDFLEEMASHNTLLRWFHEHPQERNLE